MRLPRAVAFWISMDGALRCPDAQKCMQEKLMNARAENVTTLVKAEKLQPGSLV